MMRSENAPLIERRKKGCFSCSCFKCSCCDRLLVRLLQLSEKKSLTYQQIKNTLLEFFGTYYAITSSATMAANLAYALGAPRIPGHVFTDIGGGISWGPSLFALPTAALFALADAETNTATSVHITAKTTEEKRAEMRKSESKSSSQSAVNLAPNEEDKKK